MYSKPSRSLAHFFLFLFLSIFASASSLLYPIEGQLPLIARIDQPYSWSFSPSTFASPGVSAERLPSWLSLNNFTFSGTPSANDEGSNDVILSSGGTSDEFSICVTHFPAPVLQVPLEKQFISGNPSFSSVFFLNPNSALAGPRPAVRVPLHWSFSIGLDGGTFSNPGGELFYYALQANGSSIPPWLTFNGDTITFDGVAKAQEGDRFELMLIASDQAGYSAEQLPFDLIIASHELSYVSTPVLPINVTQGEDVNFNFQDNDWVFEGIRLDNSSIHADNISSIQVDTSGLSWLDYNSFTLHGSSSDSGASYMLPINLTALNQTLLTNISLVVYPSYFSASELPNELVDPGSEFSFSLDSYLSQDHQLQGHDIDISASFSPNTTSSFLSFSDNTIEGSVPMNPGSSHANVTFTAYDHTLHISSHASLYISFRDASNDAASLSSNEHKQSILGIGVGVSVIAGIVLLALLMAAIRKWCRVRDTVVDSYSKDERISHSDNGGKDAESSGYGWTEKFGLDFNLRDIVLPMPASAFHLPYPGLGVGFAPSFHPNSPPSKMTTKGAFFQDIRTAVRKFSGPNSGTSAGSVRLRESVGRIGKRIRSATRKSAISRPMLVMSNEGRPNEDSMAALQRAAGLRISSNPDIQYASAASDSVNVPEGDGLSIGFNSSPTSSTGASNETGKDSVPSIPRQRADFGPPRSTVAPVNKKPVTPSNFGHNQGRRKSTDTQVTESTHTSNDRDREADIEEAVIVTASHAPSIRSARSSYSYVPSTYTRESASAGIERGKNEVVRPRLVQFTSARSVPVPVPASSFGASLNDRNARIGGEGPRRGSQIATVVSPAFASPASVKVNVTTTAGNLGIDADDAILTEGMQYVRAFGGQDEEPEQRYPPNTGWQAQPQGHGPPVRSNSKRSSAHSYAASASRGRLSPATTTTATSTSGTGSGTTTGTQSPIPTQSSYVYPSPSQSTESKLNSRSSKGSRGSLMMSRILVRCGEAFAFKYPVVISPVGVAGANRLPSIIARPLYSGGRLPGFLSYSVSETSTTSPSKVARPREKAKERKEVEFWGTPGARDVGELVVGIFAQDSEDREENCVGKLVVEVVGRG